jgi:hypothetical protein
MNNHIREGLLMAVLSVMEHYMAVCTLANENPILANWANRMFASVAMRLSAINVAIRGAESAAGAESAVGEGGANEVAADAEAADEDAADGVSAVREPVNAATA